MGMRSWLGGGLVLVILGLGCGPDQNGTEDTATVASEAGADTGTAKAACSHKWEWQNILSITSINDSKHALFGSKRCTKCGATKYATDYESHNYPSRPSWEQWNPWTFDVHEHKADYYCPTCGHTRHDRTFEGHECESIYDTQCGLCGYSNVRLCG